MPSRSSNGLVIDLVFPLGVVVELSTRDGNFFTNVDHLYVEFNVNGNIVKKATLMSRESVPGIWETDEFLAL
jgi:hypothetical protein